MKRTLKLLGLGAGLLAAFAVTAEPAAAQSTLDIVKNAVTCVAKSARRRRAFTT